MRLYLLAIIFILINDHTYAATTEQLRQWILNNKETFSKNSDLAGSILKLFGWENNPLSTTTKAPLAKAISVTSKDSNLTLEVCPFGAEPLVQSGKYVYCRLSNDSDCPLGFSCDQSIHLSRTICCRDKQRQINRGDDLRNIHKATIKWNTVTPTIMTAPSQMTTRRAPWYIKERSTTVKQVSAQPTTTTTSTTTTTTTTTTTMAPTTTKSSWAKLWTTTVAPKQTVNVTVVQTGSIRPLNDGQNEVVATITVVNDNGFVVLIDTGSSSDTERLLQSLARESLTLDQINTVVITHASPGNMGNMNFFAQKPILYHSQEYVGRHVSGTELRERPYRKLSSNIELWKTPGHTQHDLSVLVHSVAGYGTMAIVGDLIPNELLLSQQIDMMASDGVWDSAIKRQNANLIVCMADWIVPGHGQPFRVLPQYRQKAGCTRLLARHVNKY